MKCTSNVHKRRTKSSCFVNKVAEINHLPMDIQKRISYLHQLQHLVNQIKNDKNERTKKKQIKSKSHEGIPGEPKTESKEKLNHTKTSLPMDKLNSFYGNTAKEVSMKHNAKM